MSLLIKGMKMPPDIEGAEVIIHIKPDGTVFDMRGVHLQAQAVEVPTPHGRLIDTNKLEVHDGWLSEAEGYSTHITFVYSNAIDLAPTIIEAEEEG